MKKRIFKISVILAIILTMTMVYLVMLKSKLLQTMKM